QRVSSLLVWGAQARWIASPDHPWGQTQEEHDRMVAMIDDDWPSFEYITGPGAGVGRDADPAFIESLSRYMRAAANPSAVHAYEQMNGQIDTRPILPSIQAPTLVMNRTGDPCANVEAARDMASRIPGAKFKEYPGNSHSMMLDDMETVLSDIQEFITGERPIDSFDRILATVLFLDIASSTERAADLGDTPWRNLLNSCYAIVRKELARFRGKETNTTGDSFGCAAAPSSNIAVTPSSAHLIQLRITHLIILPAISGDSADISIAMLKAPDIRSSCWSITPRRPQPTRRHDDRADAAAESSADRATRNSHEVAPVTGTR